MATNRSIRSFACMTLLLLGACAHKESYDLRTYMAETAQSPIEADHALSVAQPLFLSDCTDQSGPFWQASLVERIQFAEQMGNAIATVTGATVKKIVFVGPQVANVASGGGTLDGSLNPGCDRCRIGKSYVSYLNDRHESTLMNAMGQAGWSKLQYRVRSTLKGVSEPGVQETVFYYLAYATYLPYDYNRVSVQRDFEALVQHLSFAVPLGEVAGEPGTWYVKVR
jgi:hypothetical protein